MPARSAHISSETHPTHYPALDGLRGVAVLLILLHHFVLGYPGAGRSFTFLKLGTLFMWSGVDLFFVLSGFLITGILVDAKDKPRYFRTFYARRVLRIFPLYYAALFLIFVVLPRLGIVTGETGQVYYWTYLANLAMHGWPNPMVSHFWTLAIEEQFYFVWPLIIFLIPTNVLRRLLPALIAVPMLLRLVLSLLGSDIIPLHVGTLTHSDGLIMGSAIAVILRTTKARWQPSNKFAIISAIAIACIYIRASFGYFPITFTLTNWNMLQRTISFTWIAGGYAWLLYLCVGQRNDVQSFFQMRWLRWLGRYSYGIYVLHKPLIALLVMIPLPAALSQLGKVHPIVLAAVYIPLFLVASIGAAYLSYHLFEKHFLKLKRYFTFEETAKSAGENVESLPVAFAANE